MGRKFKTPQISDLCQFFWHVEKQHALLDRNMGGWPLWEYCRINLYFLMLSKLNVGQQQQQPSILAPQSLLRQFLETLKTWTIRNPFFQLSRCDTVVLEHPRAVFREGFWIDIYTHFIEKEWDKQGKNWRSLTPDWAGRNVKQDQPERFRTLALRRISTICRIVRPAHLQAADLEIIKKIEKEAKKRFGDSIDFANKLTYFLNRLSGDFTAWSLLFRIWKPRELFVVMGYSINSSVCLAAKRLGIKVTELQHGNFSKFHLGYSYPNPIKNLQCFPNEFLVWSEAWKGRIPFSPKLCHVTVRPFEWLEENRTRHAAVTKQQALLVLSQGMLGDLVAEKLLQHIDRWKDWKIFYKLHPGEFSRWESYPSLQKLCKEHDVEVVTKGDLHELMARCSDQVGVFSTAVYEGLEFDCKTWLLDLPGVESMEDLVKSGEAELLS